MISGAINIIDNLTQDMRRSSTHIEIELEDQFFEAQDGDPAIDQAPASEVEASEAENVEMSPKGVQSAEAEACMASVVEACTGSDEICLADPGLVVEDSITASSAAENAPPSYNIVNFLLFLLKFWLIFRVFGSIFMKKQASCIKKLD